MSIYIHHDTSDASFDCRFTDLRYLLWKWKQGHLPFEDGLVFLVYFFTILLMIGFGVVEALVMKRKPLGLDKHLHEE